MKGVKYEKRIASEKEYREALVKKLLEEAHEFAETPTEEELADVLEVALALKTLPEYASVEMVRKTKKEERGGFEKRIILKGER